VSIILCKLYSLIRNHIHQYKEKIALDYAKLVYAGKWMTPLKEAMDAFIEKTQENVNGKVQTCPARCKKS